MKCNLTLHNLLNNTKQKKIKNALQKNPEIISLLKLPAEQS